MRRSDGTGTIDPQLSLTSGNGSFGHTQPTGLPSPLHPLVIIYHIRKYMEGTLRSFQDSQLLPPLRCKLPYVNKLLATSLGASIRRECAL